MSYNSTQKENTYGKKPFVRLLQYCMNFNQKNKYVLSVNNIVEKAVNKQD